MVSKIFRKGAYPVHQRLCNIKLQLTHSEFTMHMQNQLKVGSFVGTKAGLLHDVQFFSYARAMDERF